MLSAALGAGRGSTTRMQLYVHGGVAGRGRTFPRLDYAVDAGLRAATALDAVEAAVQLLEGDPELNAGFGATLDLDGNIELDAGIADGPSGACGAIANVTVRHPITLARRVMQETPHVLLTGAGAVAFGREMEQLSDTSDEQRARYNHAREAGRLTPELYGQPEKVDTVGAVALDEQGRLAAGSSTGGVFGKMPGRVGDAAIFGAGYYASHGAAVVGTGVGELFMQTLASFRVAELVEAGEHPQRACEQIIGLLGDKARTTAGLLALDAAGRMGAAYRGVAWAVEGPDGAVEVTRLD